MLIWSVWCQPCHQLKAATAGTRTAGEPAPMVLSALRASGSQNCTALRFPVLRLIGALMQSAVSLPSPADFAAATLFNLIRSALDPIVWPNIEAAIVRAMADFGISTDFLSIPMNGTAACTAANHCTENFCVCSLQMPRGTFAAIPSSAITSTFVGRGWGRSPFAKAVRDIAARAATIAGGHFSFIPAGGVIIFATRGTIPLNALYDFASGHWPFSSHSLLSASWLLDWTWLFGWPLFWNSKQN